MFLFLFLFISILLLCQYIVSFGFQNATIVVLVFLSLFSFMLPCIPIYVRLLPHLKKKVPPIITTLYHAVCMYSILCVLQSKMSTLFQIQSFYLFLYISNASFWQVGRFSLCDLPSLADVERFYTLLKTIPRLITNRQEIFFNSVLSIQIVFCFPRFKIQIKKKIHLLSIQNVYTLGRLSYVHSFMHHYIRQVGKCHYIKSFCQLFCPCPCYLAMMLQPFKVLPLLSLIKTHPLKTSFILTYSLSFISLFLFLFLFFYFISFEYVFANVGLPIFNSIVVFRSSFILKSS